MDITSFQDKWRRTADRLGLRVETPFVVDIDGKTLTVPVLLHNFGAVRGMLLVTDYEFVSSYDRALIALGYGYSVLSETSDESHQEEEETVIEMLSDWGWSGKESPPSWYCDVSS